MSSRFCQPTKPARQDAPPRRNWGANLRGALGGRAVGHFAAPFPDIARRFAIHSCGTRPSCADPTRAGRWRVYGLHILPNIAGPLIVSASLAFPEIVLLESGLSFLGLGVQPPLTSLGAMVGFGRDYLDIAPWILVQPSLVIVLTTLSVNLIGDWLRDRLDHRL